MLGVFSKFFHISRLIWATKWLRLWARKAPARNAKWGTDSSNGTQECKKYCTPNPESTIPQSDFQQTHQILHALRDGGLLWAAIQAKLLMDLPQRWSARAMVTIPQKHEKDAWPMIPHHPPNFEVWDHVRIFEVFHLRDGASHFLASSFRSRRSSGSFAESHKGSTESDLSSGTNGTKKPSPRGNEFGPCTLAGLVVGESEVGLCFKSLTGGPQSREFPAQAFFVQLPADLDGGDWLRGIRHASLRYPR